MSKRDPNPAVRPRRNVMYPTPWQRKMIWASLTTMAIVALGVISILLILAIGRALGYLQPILIPVAIAGILAYLLNPLVEWLQRYGITRIRAVLIAMGVATLPLLALIWAGPQIYQQSAEFAKDVPKLLMKGKEMVIKALAHYQNHADNPYVHQAVEYLQAQLPQLPPKIWAFIQSSFQGFLGAFGFILGLIVVPIYLFFFLNNAAAISKHWGDYLPLRASPFKDEVVDCLTEINSYLIAFFRGQIIVTAIDGLLLAIALAALNIPFAMLIGLAVAVLQLIPYLGVILCWIPTVLIAAIQFQDWFHPIAVTVAFLVVTNLDGLIIAPRVVGDSVGLHPMTIIVSVFVWTLLVGGILGALLAVPLTATLKVLLRRYVWQRPPDTPEPLPAPPQEPIIN